MTSQLNIKLAFFYIFFGFLVLNCALIILAWQRYYLTTDGMIELLGSLRSVYIAPMTIVLVGIYSKLRGENNEQVPISVLLFASALLLVFFWNAIITYPFFYLLLKAGPQAMNISWLSDYWRSAADFANFLSTAALTYYFVNTEK